VPEILEVEATRRTIEARALGRTIAGVDAPDAWYLKRGLTPDVVAAVLPGRRFVGARRRGKLLLLDTSARTDDAAPADDRTPDGPTLAVHLGMTGRVLVDGQPAGDELRFASNRDRPGWHRFTVRFTDGGSVTVRDPRRLGAVELDPDEDRLGVDALALTLAGLGATLRGRRAPLKAVLLDQAGVAGLGNLLVDEILWRAGLAPGRPAGSLTAAERARLARAVRTSLRVLGRRGGSHTGDLMPERQPGGHCPRDGAALRRDTVGGRTTYWCPRHQR
jgi:formamidopyrimidine-DNA glycosylase